MTTMKNRRIQKKRRAGYPDKSFRTLLLAGILSFGLVLSGCSAGRDSSGSTEGTADSVSTLLEITDPQEKAAVEAAKGKVAAMEGEPRIIATSPATAEICSRLDLDLVGVCSSTISSLPERYSEVTRVGTSMAPDMEIVASLNPELDLKPRQPPVGPAAQV